MAITWPLVGRSEEMDFLERAIAGQEISAMVVAGPAGVGKTRLAVEALARARQAGLATTWAVATASAAPPSLSGPWPTCGPTLSRRRSGWRTCCGPWRGCRR